ncbi:hypothetical protein [Streptomyces sp. NBC_01431]|uniref:hypothetical protein n=1 Tax=Streptomyces sp. NBC_01431 TaxID=2903863 RepID=UPI002E380443|nr:hypothetical protein [Streptomyces sp. NBC_01431]
MTGPRTMFRAVVTASDFERSVTEFQSARSQGHRDACVPVWIGGRCDLRASLDLAAGLYRALRQPPECAAGVVLGDVPQAVRSFARPLARQWTDGAPPAGEGSLIVLGRYADLTMEVLGPALVDAYRRGRDIFLLTGRDLHSITWTIAKQYGEVAADGETGLFTDLDTEPVSTSATYYDSRTLGGVDLIRIAAERVWKRVMVSGHGTEDSINLGAHTVCGLSPVAAPQLPGPTCSYGRGCYKPEDKLIPAHRIRAAELVLSGCDSGALADLASYSPRYQLLLNAVDGPAQAVVAALSMHQSARVENLIWLDSADRGGSTARLLNTSLRTIHPYPTFIQVGLPSSAYRHTGPTAPAPALPEEASGLVRDLGSRARGFLMTGMLPAAHPLRERFEGLAEKTETTAARPVMGLTAQRSAFLRSLERDAQSLDQAIAVRIAERPDDGLAGFPRFFGDRSTVSIPDATTTPCVLCGRTAWQYPRRGFTARVPLTTAHVCLSCGPVGYTMEGGARLDAKAAATVTAGATLRIEATVEPSRPGPVQVGVSVPWSLRAATVPPVHSVRLIRGERRSVVVEVRLDASAPPQEHHFTVFGVQDLAISLLRCPFAVLPPREA